MVRNATTDTGLSSGRVGTAVAEGTEAEVFNLNDFTHGCGIVDFGDRHVLRTDTRNLVSALRCHH